jgi:hypothetical protein
MNRNIDIQNELTTISKVVAGIPFVNTYAVSDTYFENLIAAILLKLNKEDNYQVPAGYFDGLANSILQKIKQEEKQENNTDDLPAILQQLQKVNVYTVPQGYFEQLTISTPKLEAKVIAMPTKRKSNWWKYAAAACVVAVVSISAFHFLGNTKLVQAEDKVIAGTNFTYKQLQAINVEDELSKVNSTEADKYLCENNLVACNTTPEDEAFQKQLDDLDVTDAELDNLLKEAN